MSCGAGRGRGWLNLPKNIETPKPGLPQTQIPTNDPSAPPLPHITMEHKDLIDRVKEMSLNDDGIVFNRKMQHIRSYWLQNCSKADDVIESFKVLYDVALRDVDLGFKLVTLLSAQTLITKNIHDCNLRNEFLTNLQRSYENSEHLQTTDPLLFRNYVQILGQFFYKSRMKHGGGPYRVIAVPLLACLERLLNSKSIPDLTLCTNQIFMHAPNLKILKPDDFMKLSVKIRTVIATEAQLITEAKLWMLLALDVCNLTSGLLPPELFKYYEGQLGSAAMANFQIPPDVPSIETLYFSKAFEKYKSPVNVLQISTSPTEAPHHDIQNSHFMNSNDYESFAQNGCSKDVTTKSKEKTGRPILGSGVRHVKGKGNEDNGALNRQQSTGRTNSTKHLPPSKNKGWEHDDRFENEYD